MSILLYESLKDLLEDGRSNEDNYIASLEETEKKALKEDLFKYKQLLLKAIPPKKQTSILDLLKKYISGDDRKSKLINDWKSGIFGNITLNEVIHQHINKYMFEVSNVIEIPVYVLKTITYKFDIRYQIDKNLASKYVDKFTQDTFSSWFNNLTTNENDRDILDLIVIAIMIHRGVKLKGKLRRLIGKIFLKIFGK